MSGSITQNPLEPPKYVAYMDLSGGLNTRKDVHALARNQLAQSVNGWYGSGNAFSKRPGSVLFAGGMSPYPTGTNVGLSASRFNGSTYILVQQRVGANTQLAFAQNNGTSFTSITNDLSPTASPINTAQMYDPQTGMNTLFIVDGKDIPQTWYGPGFTTLTPVLTSGTNCPYNHTNTAPITPKFVETAGFYLLYAGEPTEPTAVYISNPYYPQTFNLSSTTTTGILANPYIPYLVGFNDGVNGGNITGIKRLANGTSTGAVMVYKESAIYVMQQTGFFAEMYWGATLVSSSVGCLSPQSLVAFDTFHVFLGIDGVYQTDGVSVRRLSDNVPTYFDSSLNGIGAIIQNRATAVAVRQDQKYLIWFDSTGTGLLTTGLWFDFARLDADGFPCVGEIDGMTMVAATSLRGPLDDGNFAWLGGNVTSQTIYKFGVGFSDNTAPIATTFTGKADLMEDTFGPESPLELKNTNNVWLLLTAVSASSGETLTFTCAVTSDYYSSTTTNVAFLGPSSGAVFGSAIFGTATFGGGYTSVYSPLKVDPQITAQGRALQFTFSESSINPWTAIGYVAYVDRQKVAA